MKPALWMTAACVASWAVVAVVDPSARVAVLFGMLGPLVVAAGSWVVVERTFRQQPERLTATMIAAFGFKLVFFGAYVAVMLRVLEPPVIAFVTSFFSYFIGLYMMEAIYLRRLFR